MAPDINSIPKTSSPLINGSNSSATPHSQTRSTSSRRTSSQMAPPPPPHHTSIPNSPLPTYASMADSTGGGGIGPGPLRHPRPLTAAELHLEMEKEQESIVNRLTRELSALRAQTASVASTTSTTSDHFFPATDSYYQNHSGTGTNIIPISSRRHRSSSNLSARSARSLRDNLASTTATSVSGVAAPRDQSSGFQPSSRPSMEVIRPEMSRQNSLNASGNVNHRHGSVTTSPHLTQVAYPYSQRTPASTVQSSAGHDSVAQSPFGRSPSFSSALAAARYEEASLHKAELEAMKRENEALKAKVKQLEMSLAAATVATASPPPTD